MPVFTINKHVWSSDIKETTTGTRALVFTEKDVIAAKTKDDKTLTATQWTTETIAVILIDEFGNEKTITLTKNDFE